MLIAQISDCHVASPAKPVFGRVDTAAMLSRAIEAVTRLPRAPDVVIVSGDIAESGSPAEYERFLAILAGLSVPVIPVVGNHDRREALATAFDLRARYDVQPGFVQYEVGGHPVRIIVLDTVTEGSSDPAFCAERLAWLADRLRSPAQPTLIAMHHPPFAAGVAWMEPANRDWAQGLADLVARSPGVVRVVCGHVHRPMTRLWANTCAMAAPSTAHQVYPDMSQGGRRPKLSLEAPGFLLHLWEGGDLTSYGLSVPGLHEVLAP